jgi:hypothetical protein
VQNSIYKLKIAKSRYEGGSRRIVIELDIDKVLFEHAMKGYHRFFEDHSKLY